MNFIINGEFKDDTSNPSSLPPLYSAVLISHSCNTKNEFTGILGIKKEPNGLDVKNIK